MPHQREGGNASGGEAVWGTGSSLYDSYELAAVRRLLDRSLAAARARREQATDRGGRLGGPTDGQEEEGDVADALQGGGLLGDQAEEGAGGARLHQRRYIAHGGAVEPVVSPHGKV
jgi:hypothetical protein